MRVMMINKADKRTEAGVMPSEKLLTNMQALLEEMHKEGVLLAGDGLKPSSFGVRIHVSGNQRTVTDGPFTETKELVAGYAIIKVNAMDDAIGWAQRFIDVVKDEADDEFSVELRPFFEMDDFGAEFTPELRAAEERLRTEIAQAH